MYPKYGTHIGLSRTHSFLCCLVISSEKLLSTNTDVGSPGNSLNRTNIIVSIDKMTNANRTRRRTTYARIPCMMKSSLAAAKARWPRLVAALHPAKAMPQKGRYPVHCHASPTTGRASGREREGQYV